MATVTKRISFVVELEVPDTTPDAIVEYYATREAMGLYADAEMIAEQDEVPMLTIVDEFHHRQSGQTWFEPKGVWFNTLTQGH